MGGGNGWFVLLSPSLVGRGIPFHTQVGQKPRQETGDHDEDDQPPVQWEMEVRDGLGKLDHVGQEQNEQISEGADGRGSKSCQTGKQSRLRKE